ncbi:MAG: hypothetical protein HKP13_05410 [Gammaproteobacteria bacterium]|nr:hypothetical protein [Gammaproteobacteria bacterium]
MKTFSTAGPVRSDDHYNIPARINHGRRSALSGKKRLRLGKGNTGLVCGGCEVIAGKEYTGLRRILFVFKARQQAHSRSM